MQSVRVAPLALAAALFLFVACGGDSDGGTAEDTFVAPDVSADVAGPDVAPDVPSGDEDVPPAGPDTVETDVPAASCVEPCSDGDPCTIDDRCVDGVCQGLVMDCDDQDPCTRDACAEGTCQNDPLTGGTCEDGDLCTTGDTCQSGECVGAGLTCDDQNPCTSDTCDAATGECAHTALVGEACDDGNRCTFNGVCDAAGVCVGEQVDCDDGIACTNDVCTEEGECIHVAAKAACDDGLLCTADWCDPVGDCQHAGVLAQEPIQDGLLGEWNPSGVVAINSVQSTVPGGSLTGISVAVSGRGLHLGVKGTAAASQVWMVVLDTDFASLPQGTGVRDLSTLSGDALSVAGALDVQVDAFGFGAEFAVIGTVQETGCRSIAADGSASTAACTIQIAAAEKSIEITIPWLSLLGTDGPPESAPRIVAGFALLGSIATGLPSNQILPEQSAPIASLFVVPVAAGECLGPFCGNGIQEDGEYCDDGNDDPNDECAGCALPAPPGMVTVPGGEFIMGHDTIFIDDSFRPAHAVWVDTFYIDRTEVTVADFAAFLQASDFDVVANTIYDEDGNPLYQCSDSHSYVDCGFTGTFQVEPGYEDHPISETLWWGAHLYCQWLGKRLPTEAEWEKAARGTDEWKYPWGDERRTDVLNCAEFACHDGYTGTGPVGSWPGNASPYGALDMAGNVWEWVHDWFDASYYLTSPYLNPLGPCDGALTCATTTTRVARGGSWDDAIPAEWEEEARVQNRLTTYFRHSEANEGCNSDVGFRCAMDFVAE